MRGLLAGLFAGAAVAAAPASSFELGFPVACTLGRDCMIQHTVDRDPGPGAADLVCGHLSYDGHKGTDIRLPSRAAMRAGVEVLAAAPGIVAAMRDGVPDIAAGEPGAPDIAGRECGNGVLIRHESGHTTQYCHLREDSVRVAEGETVAAGQPVGLIGLSGQTQFPHLHFVLRNPDGDVIDPLDGRPMSALCGAGGAAPLWPADPSAGPPRGGLLAAGMLDRAPDYDEIRDTAPSRDALPRSAPALVAWVHFFGLHEGDRIEQRLVAPDGSVVAESEHVMTRNRATEFRFTGRRVPDGGWPPGIYSGLSRLLRGAEEIAAAETRLRID